MRHTHEALEVSLEKRERISPSSEAHGTDTCSEKALACNCTCYNYILLPFSYVGCQVILHLWLAVLTSFPSFTTCTNFTVPVHRASKMKTPRANDGISLQQ